MDERARKISATQVEEQHGRFAVLADGDLLRTPAGQPFLTEPRDLAYALAEELLADGVADVTEPSLYAFVSTQRDFIEPRPEQTVEALVELLSHDYLLHPDDRLGIRHEQVASWRPQFELWQRVAGRQPPCAPPRGEPPIARGDYVAFRRYLADFNPAQLTVAIHAANLLKSATLGMLLAQMAIDPEVALQAANATLRLTTAESEDDPEAQETREDYLREVIARLLRYALLAGRG